MEKKYRRPLFSTVFSLFLCIVAVPFVYGFFREAFPVENRIYTILCILASFVFGIAALSLLIDSRTIVIVSDKGLLIRSPLKSFFVTWDDICEFGKERKIVYGGGAWRYYIRSVNYTDKKIVLGFKNIKNFQDLNNAIIQNAKYARLEGTHFME